MRVYIRATNIIAAGAIGLSEIKNIESFSSGVLFCTLITLLFPVSHMIPVQFEIDSFLTPSSSSNPMCVFGMNRSFTSKN